MPRSLSADLSSDAKEDTYDYNSGFFSSSGKKSRTSHQSLDRAELGPKDDLLRSPHSHYLCHSPHAGKLRASSFDGHHTTTFLHRRNAGGRSDGYGAAVNARMSQVNGNVKHESYEYDEIKW